MILQASQDFTLPFTGTRESALEFVRSPQVALSRARFLTGLHSQAEHFSGELVVRAPGLGDVILPFHSVLERTPEGALLRGQNLEGERAWVSVNGRASVLEGRQIEFQFDFVAHVGLPAGEGWGGAAFEKMVKAASQRTLARIAEALPRDIGAALSEVEAAKATG